VVTNIDSVAKRVLVVDDEPEIGEILEGYLRKESFEPVIASTVKAALAEIDRQVPDLIILDLGLPDGNGLDVLRRANEAGHIPSIMLTTRSEEIDRIVGLEAGADDYIAKPFSPREVIARIRALFRRIEGPAKAAPAQGAVYRVRDLEINEAAHEVRMDGKPVSVRPSEFRILTLLARHAGQVLSRAQMLDLLHDDGSIFERTLDRHINHLRHKLEPDPANPTYLITVYGVGYKLDSSEVG
jgi:DNA-binding response OmpR family regulator